MLELEMPYKMVYHQGSNNKIVTFKQYPNGLEIVATEEEMQVYEVLEKMQREHASLEERLASSEQARKKK